MSICMAKGKPRIAYTVEDRYKRAFESHAATVGKTHTELFHMMVEEFCVDALERVDAAIAVEKSMREAEKADKKKDHKSK